jgi:CRISPR-associated endonuclease/helicase Cas3
MTMNDIKATDRRFSEALQLWAKTGQRGQNLNYHPLLFHMLDVAAVAGLVWDHHLTPVVRKRLERALIGKDTRTLIAFVTGAHDIGKACPGFQKRVVNLRNCLELPFSNNDQVRPHGFISAFVLNKNLGDCRASALLGQIAGGHHGVFPRSMELGMGRDTLGNKDWEAARCNLLNELANIVGLNLKGVHKIKIEINDPFLVPILAGFISVVDWIGSNQDFFPCVAECGKPVKVNAAEYWSKAQEQAKKALEKLGWLPGVNFARETQFDGVFPSFTPNALQKTASELASRQNSPYLMIMEAPMGHGKTEQRYTRPIWQCVVALPEECMWPCQLRQRAMQCSGEYWMII